MTVYFSDVKMWCLLISSNKGKCFSNDVNVLMLSPPKGQCLLLLLRNVLRISRYSGFLWVVLTNTGIFLRGLKLSGESRTQQVLLVYKKKIGEQHLISPYNLTVINYTGQENKGNDHQR